MVSRLTWSRTNLMNRAYRKQFIIHSKISNQMFQHLLLFLWFFFAPLLQELFSFQMIKLQKLPTIFEFVIQFKSVHLNQIMDDFKTFACDYKYNTAINIIRWCRNLSRIAIHVGFSVTLAHYSQRLRPIMSMHV